MISSPTNPRVKALVRLRKRRERDRTGRFLVEGRREVERAVAGGVAIDETYVREDAPAPEEAIRLSRAVFAKVAYRETSEVIALAHHFPTALDRIEAGADPLLLVVAAVEKPGNLGAMIRSAVAAGCAGVIVADPATDVFNPNVVRGSMGTLFLVPVAVASGDQVRAWLAAHGVARWASSEHAALPYWSAPLTGAVALVVGSEDAGLGPEWLADRERTLVIPAAAPASLNAATAAALLLFEARRQRRRAAQPLR